MLLDAGADVDNHRGAKTAVMKSFVKCQKAAKAWPAKHTCWATHLETLAGQLKTIATPLSIARRKGHDAVAAKLMAAGASQKHAEAKS